MNWDLQLGINNVVYKLNFLKRKDLKNNREESLPGKIF